MITNQQVFNTVVTNLRKQNEKSIGKNLDENVCLYRGPDGKKCAAGWLIPNKLYKPQFEGFSISQLCNRKNTKKIFGHDVESLDLINMLQNIHDQTHPVYWEYQWRVLAEQYGLEMPVTAPF